MWVGFNGTGRPRADAGEVEDLIGRDVTGLGIEEPRRLFDLGGIHFSLEDLLGVDVDVISDGSIKASDAYILEEAVPPWESVTTLRHQASTRPVALDHHSEHAHPRPSWGGTIPSIWSD